MLAALGVEVGGGVAGQLYSAQKFYTGSKVVSALGKAQKATALGVAGPQILEPWSTGSFLLSSGLFWGASNLAGQGIRNAYGLQNGISYGELMATGIFGSLTGTTSTLSSKSCANTERLPPSTSYGYSGGRLSLKILARILNSCL